MQIQKFLPSKDRGVENLTKNEEGKINNLQIYKGIEVQIDRHDIFNKRMLQKLC